MPARPARSPARWPRAGSAPWPTRTSTRSPGCMPPPNTAPTRCSTWRPPLLTGIDKATGRRRKIAISGRVALPLFRVLRHGKALRGTPLDPFGWQADRRHERRADPAVSGGPRRGAASCCGPTRWTPRPSWPGCRSTSAASARSRRPALQEAAPRRAALLDASARPQIGNASALRSSTCGKRRNRHARLPPTRTP